MYGRRSLTILPAMLLRLPIAALAATAAAGALAASPAAAATGSAIVYVNDGEGDVWQVQPDGKNAHAVTTDGTKAAPYARPRLAPDGSIWALRGRAVVHLSGTGQPLGTFTPAPLKDSDGNDVDRDPEAFDVTPDGTKLAYGVKQIKCYDDGSCNMDSITGIFDTTGKLLKRDTRFLDASWLSNSRMVGNDGGGYGEIRLFDGSSASLLWYTNKAHDIPGWTREPAVSPDGTQLAELRTVGGVGQFLLTFQVPSGAAPVGFGTPEPMCIAEKALGTGTSPTWAPDGKHVVVAAMAEGLYAYDFSAVGVDSECSKGTATKIAPVGASQPDWGTLPVPDPPVEVPTTPTTPTTTTTTTTTTVPTVPTVPTTPIKPVEPSKPAKAALTVPAQKLKTIRKRGVKVRLTGALPGKLQIVVKAKGKVVGKATVKVPKSGTLDATVKLTKAGARALAKAKTASLTVSAGGLTRTLKAQR